MTHTLDSYGGTNQLKGKSTGWFHLEELGGRRWFITPEGNAFFPVSLAHIYTGNSQPTVQKLLDGDKEAWIEKWFDQMRGLGLTAHSPVSQVNAEIHRAMWRSRRWKRCFAANLSPTLPDSS